MVVIAKSAPKQGSDVLPVFDPKDGPFWTCKADGEAKRVMSKKGISSAGKGGIPALTVPQVLKEVARRKGKKPALRVERPSPPNQGGATADSKPRHMWKQWNYEEQYRDSCRVAKGLIKLGVKQHDAVCIFGFNAPEWSLSLTGAMTAGAKGAGVYPSDTPDQLQFKCHHADASVATCEGEKELDKFKQIIDRVPYLKAIVCWALKDVSDITRADGSVVKVLTWEDLLRTGDQVDDSELEARVSSIKPTHCAALIYTSGTTGNPKAVMISHDNCIFEVYSVLETLKFIGETAEQERIISYLPLSHVAGMVVDIMTPIVAPYVRPGWVTVHFARPYDLKAGTLGNRLRAVQPTIFLGVPRVWEKISEKIKAVGASTKGLKKKIAMWGKGKGLVFQRNSQLGGSGQKPMFYGIAEKLVLSKVTKTLGLDNCKYGFTGAAPITLDTLEFFGALGININEVYGMSECTGAVTWSTDTCHIWGSAGFAMPGCDVKIFKVAEDGTKTECPPAKDMFHATDAEQGEICFRGRNTMMGYLANPKLGKEHVATIKKKNKEAIDEEGWLHSGDMGCLSKTGMLKITGRYKELIISAGGENIAPVPIEDNIKKICQGISNIMMVGDQRKFNVALISLKAQGASGELPGGDKLDGAALQMGKAKTISAAMDDKAVIDAISKAIKQTNADGSVVPSNAAKIQKFTILPRDFSVQTGELTATLKLKRGVAAKKYLEAIEAMYASKDMYVKYVGPSP